MRIKALSIALGALLLSAGAVSAATVTDNINFRNGPGLNYSIIGWAPVGTYVRVLSCDQAWCRVATWYGAVAYANRKFISTGGSAYSAYAAAPEYGTYSYGWVPTARYSGWPYWYWY